MSALLKSSGVYQITCKSTGKKYIGSAKKFAARWSLHRVQLRQGNHHSPHLQNAWNKHGKDAFEFKVLLLCAPEMMLFYEQIFLDALRPEFNTCQTAGNVLGMKHSAKAKENMRAGQREKRAKHEWKGKKRSLIEIAELENVDHGVLISRVLGCGMSLEKAISTPLRPFKYILTHNGMTKTLAEWSVFLGVSEKRIQSRLVKGWSISECIDYFYRVEKRISMSEFCRVAGANLQTTKSRIQSGMSIMDAITMPIGPTSRTRVKEVV